MNTTANNLGNFSLIGNVPESEPPGSRSVYLKMTRTLIPALLIAAAFAATRPAVAKECGEVCVDAVETRRGVEIYVINPHPWPVTASLYVRGRNLDAEGGNRRTGVIDGKSRRRLLSLSRYSDDRRYYYRYWYDWTFGRIDADHDDSVLYRLPYAAGSRYRVIQGFGGRFSHDGRERYAVDFRMPVGTPVHAARGGIVVDVEESHDEGGWDERYYATANYIVIMHDDDTTGEYYHLMHQGAAVEVGDRVEAGQHIGWSGNTGHTTTPHLHFAVYRADTWGRTQSVPFRFITSEGVIDAPRPWRRYGVVEIGAETPDS